MKITVSMKVGLSVFLALLVITTPAIPQSTLADEEVLPVVKVNLLYNAGVMIEALGMRLYIDPWELTENYTDLDADIVMVTHPHGDHYDAYDINSIQKNDTVNIFPENMTDAISAFDGVAVNPGDSVQVGPVNITAFWMYTWAPEGYEASHPIEANWTGYIIDIDGFTIFHAGDSKNIPEYVQLNGTVDVALLPLGPGCQTMTGMEVVEALEVIRPDYFIPIHYTEGADDDFCTLYSYLIMNRTGCVTVHLKYFSSHIFNELPLTSTTSTSSSGTTSTSSSTETTTSETSTTTVLSATFDPTTMMIVGGIGGVTVGVVLVVLLFKRRTG